LPTYECLIEDGALENGIIRIRVDAGTGNLAELTLNVKSANLISTTSGEAANECAILPFRSVPDGKMYMDIPWKPCSRSSTSFPDRARTGSR
jgi:hypothetical protein